MSRNDYIAKKISSFADKHGITDEQAIRILYNTKDFSEIWEISGLDDYLLDVAHRYKIKL